ncbi:MAG TPA: PAS domain S-box protein, partial [Paenisporosarcina sp.]|nr:PAS domain S-box protein [Paenisporosarcina sp.]
MSQVIESMGSKEILNNENTEAMYRQIIEYSVETIIIHLDHKILYINQAGADFLKGLKEEIIGSDILSVFHEDEKDLIRERIEQGMNGDATHAIEKTVIRIDGSHVDVELYCHPVQFGNKKAIQSVLRDITIRKETEKML